MHDYTPEIHAEINGLIPSMWAGVQCSGKLSEMPGDVGRASDRRDTGTLPLTHDNHSYHVTVAYQYNHNVRR